MKGWEVNNDHVEVQKKEVTTIPRNFDTDFLCKETKVGSKEVNEANVDGALTEEEKRYGGSKPQEPSIQVALPLDEDTQLPHVDTQPPLEDTQTPLEET